MENLERASLEAVRDRLMHAMRTAPKAGGGEQALAMHLARVLKCLRDNTSSFDVLNAADIACDEAMPNVVFPPTVKAVSAIEAACYAELCARFPDMRDSALRMAVAFRALTMTDVELLLFVSEDIEF